MFKERYDKLMIFLKSYLNNEIDPEFFVEEYEVKYYFMGYSEDVNLHVSNLLDIVDKYEPYNEHRDEYTLDEEGLKIKVKELYKELETLTEEQIKGE